VGGAVGCFCRQAGGEAVPLPAPVHIRAAGGSLSSGPWNKCLACGYGLDIPQFLRRNILGFFHTKTIAFNLPSFISIMFSIFVTKGIAEDSNIFVLKTIAKLSTASV